MRKFGTHLLRMTIARKLLLGFLSCGILTILIALIALYNLQRLNEINNRIIERDVPLIAITDKMIEALLAQELYGRRLLILKSSKTESLFSKRSEEFKKLRQQMADLPETSNLPLSGLETLHKEYNRLYETGLEKGEGFSSLAFHDRDQQIRRKHEEILQMVKGISHDAREDQNEKGMKTLSIGHWAIWMTAGLSTGGLLLGIIIALIITRNISRSIHHLKLSTLEISDGKFDHLPKVRNRDELGDLSQAFHRMAQRLKQVEEEREGLIQTLRDALAKIKRLHGMLPICASCKKIRDDKGYWNELEGYIEEHSEAEFTHGFCPDCMEKLYGVSLDEEGNLKKK